MPEFFYTARTEDGKLVKDRIKIKDEASLKNYLNSKKLILTSTKQSDKQAGGILNKLLNRLTSVPVVEKIFFTQNLSVMVKTGFSLAQALNTLSLQTTHKKFKIVINDLKHDVENGISFSNALEKHPKIFSELFINMIAAGEVSGKLDEVLISLTKQMKKDHKLVSNVRTAMMYPAVIIIAMIGIGIVMMVTVIPQLVGIFEEAEAELPFTTKILITTSNLLSNQGIYIAIGIGILFYVFMQIKKSKKGKLIIHKLLLKIPIFKNIIKKINIARFTRTLSSLMKTDIPIVQTLQIISKTLGNVLFKEALLDASEKVKKGISISKTLETKPELFSPIVTQMINIGEESGTLDTISDEIADFYEEDVDQTMEGLSSIIEPILMLVIGGVVMVVALAVLQPMYGLVETI
ncbi:MAG: type II secretion system F family protein [bacterium]|nr:type II secretion system F family protein [bacterium]